MQTKNLIQTQANVIKISTLVKGDVLKIISKKYSDTYETKYGVVLDLMNTGNKTFIQILEYTKDYNSVEAEIKTYAGTDDLTIFPATLDEVKSYFKEAINTVKENIKEKKKELQDKIEALKKAESFANGELSKSLTEPEFLEITQDEFNKKKQELLG